METHCNGKARKRIAMRWIREANVKNLNRRRTMKIRITAIEEVLGSSPSNEDLLGTYIASKAPNEELSAQEVENIKAQQAEDRVTVFPKLADGTPFIWDYQIKGMFKDSCKMLAKAGKAGYPGGKACAAIKAYKQAIDGLLFVTPREIPFNLNGMKMDYCERSLRADTPMGPRTSIAKSESVPAGSTIEFSVVCLDPALQKMVKECLDYGTMRGLGQWRNSGKGRFVWDLLDESGAVIGGNNEFEE
uniref:Type III-A CRISPR-associated protein Csm1 complex, Type III-A, CRISPR-Cas.9A n=1 Tax=Ackermannviridae sp. ctkHJ36 TaxID=2825754 RepID=A0A8S5UK78_9CAUD|nr:MAG TPA: Type III-A CRISPR-associated protein Csm1 complex, Type III-A, CRISPR-Cas.9A [Ackermannviridae sp. ctkHJ36]